MKTLHNQISPTISNITVTNVSCNGGSDGSAVPVTGGTPNYNYSWSGGSNSNLISGVYTSTVTDDNGCVTSQDFTVTEPSVSGTVFKRFCNLFRWFRQSGNTAIVSGGVGPYNLLWSDGSTVNFVNTFALWLSYFNNN